MLNDFQEVLICPEMAPDLYPGRTPPLWYVFYNLDFTEYTTAKVFITGDLGIKVFINNNLA